MTLAMAAVCGILFASAVWLMTRRELAKLIIGLALLSHAVNLVIFVVGGLQRSGTPVIAEGDRILRAPFPDPLPQALILTAIVISFGVLVFTALLVYRAVRVLDAEDVDRLDRTER